MGTEVELTQAHKRSVDETRSLCYGNRTEFTEFTEHIVEAFLDSRNAI
jgi:hypothetical protein